MPPHTETYDTTGYSNNLNGGSTVKVTTRNFQFLLILVAPFDKSVMTLASAVVKILACVCAFVLEVSEGETVMGVFI